MKKAIFIIPIIIVIVTSLAAVLWNGERAQAVSVRFNIKDLPEHGLFIISPSHPSFDEIMAAYVKGKPNTAPEDLKPFSIFLKNMGNKAIVAYKMKWECMRPDGTVTTKAKSNESTWILRNSGWPDHKAAVAEDINMIRPNATWFISLGAPSEPVSEAATGMTSGGHVAIALSDESRTDRPYNRASIQELVNTELAKYTSITVSIDGVVFEDGTFVGPDTTNFYSEIKAEMKASYDVLHEIEVGVKDGTPIDEVFKHIEEMANAPATQLGPAPTTTEFYSFYKKLFAKDTLGTKNLYGAEEAVKRALKQLSTPWVKVHKLQSDGRFESDLDQGAARE